MKLTLIGKKPEVSNVTSFTFHPDEPFDWQAGQYLHYVFEHADADDRGFERYFTIASAPFEKEILITTRTTSERGSSFKKALAAAPIGTELEADGPKGEFVIDDEPAHHILIAGGIGVTPYRAMLLQLDRDNKDLKIDLLYLNDMPELVFGDVFHVLEARRPNFHIHEFIGRRLNKADLKPFLAKDKTSTTIFYLSGPRGMVEAYQGLLLELGVRPEHIKTDYFPGY